MNDAVFISDLHLHPDRPFLTTRFQQWIRWAIKNTRTVYILGDFFHAWAGDDTLNAWSRGIATELAQFHEHDIPVYFMAGNRDFLIGKNFARLAHINIISEPYVVQFGDNRVLIVHGDRYCTLDKAHQWFRKVTRNPLFRQLFLSLPRRFREKIVCQVRKQSQSRMLPQAKMMTVSASLGIDAVQYDVSLIIHGHTHDPIRITHQYDGKIFEQIVLSDWEENVLILCYNESKTFYYTKFDEGNHHAYSCDNTG